MKLAQNGGSVLIIDDDANVARALERVLEGAHRVETVSTAEEGIARAQVENFDVLVTDLQMPGMSGLDLIKELRTDAPIILMTGHHTTDTAIEAMKQGAYDYLLKPVDPDEFLALIEKAMQAGKAKASPVAEKEKGDAVEPLVGRS